MATNGDILEFILRSTYESDSNRNLNVFHYSISALTTPVPLSGVGQGLIDGWFTNLVAVLQPVTATIITWQGAQINNLSDPTEFFDGNFTDPAAGSVAGDVLPPYASYGFLLNRTNKTTRNGYKRFGGVPESLQVNGVPTAPASADLLNLAAFLGAPNDVVLDTIPADTVTLFPVIVRKSITGALVTSQLVQSATFRTIGTQNSRKFGRGM